MVYRSPNQTNETLSRQNRVETFSRHSRDKVETKSRVLPLRGVPLLLLLTILLHSCAISFKMNGANIDYQTTHSISVAEFPNNAAMVYPTLSNSLSEAIRDLYIRNTRLKVLSKGGDLELEGEIVGYELTQGAISADSYASESKLTIRVTVHYTNNIHPEESFDKTYSAYQTFDSSRMLTDVQDELCATMVVEIAENIYNDTVAKW